MGNLTSSLQDCIELDDSMLSIKNDSTVSFVPKFILIKRNLYLLVDDWTAEKGKFVISLKNADSGNLLDYKFVNGVDETTPIVIKQVRNTSNYVLKFHSDMQDGIHKFSIRLDKKRICRIYIYREIAGVSMECGSTSLRENVPVSSTATQGDAQASASLKTDDIGGGGGGGVSVTQLSTGAPQMPGDLVLHDPIPKFIQDGPQFRTHLSNLESTLFIYKSHLKSLYERSSKLKELLRLASKELNQMANKFDELHDLVKDQHVSSIFRHLLVSSAAVCTAQARILMRKSNATGDDLLTDLRHYLQTIDLKLLTNNKKLYHDQAKDFYSYVGKHLSQNSDSRLLPKRIQFELQRFDYFHSLLTHIFGPTGRDFSVALSRYQVSFEPTTTNTTLQLVKQYRSHYVQFDRFKGQQRMKLSKVDNYSDLNDFFQLPSVAATSKNSPLKEGLLWSNRNSGWHKQWVVLQGSLLSEYSDWKTKAKILSRPSINLTFACVRRSDKKPNGFDIITTDAETRSFQAESEDELKQWLQILKTAVGVMDIDNTEENKDPLLIVRNSDLSNSICCDCRSDKQVEWISLNLLCVTCINCSGVHRSLGTHLSKIRSLTLDSFNTPESLQLLKYVSNQNVNSLYEMESVSPILPNATSVERKNYITDKYVAKKYVGPTEDPNKLGISLIKAIHLESIYLLQKCISGGVSLNDEHWSHDENNESLFQYSLKHYEGTKDNPIFPVTEFLVLNGLHVDEPPASNSSDSQWSSGQLNYWTAKYHNHNCLHNPVSVKKLPDVPVADFSDKATVKQGQRSRRWSMGSNPNPATSNNQHLSSLISGKSKHLKFSKIQK
ncbi:GTPase-activating protein AGE1 Ecym_1029 [Eremothecium cymbalariae DBVPG|uniref:ADP-ribosylation factor GTPase-activating protein n=1 Tax=Eremothecium cymbalariae (strain CBS 270.75 / DBVPG 7215 / KCTC 17166 / NRRL Y-17582) TaxID=931890 RepID=G8JM27_ERECY|nr:hypothetical protein Ecym_1029 [Eremothecium cymbalariae DBVPG\